jgi:hypothetical protein
MNLEVILWIIFGIILSEIIYFFWYKYTCENENEYYIFESNQWILIKILSYLFGALFMVMQSMIVGDKSCIEFFCGNRNYSNLIYELFVIGAIILLYYINKWIAKYILKRSVKRLKYKK